MKTIHKYMLGTSQTAIAMPKGAEILTVKMQGNVPCLWALVDDENEMEDRKFVIFGTGHEFINAGKYIGTFLLQDHSLVFHVFESSQS